LDAETKPPNSPSETPNARGDQKGPEPIAEIPAQTAYLDPTRNYPVREDWMVGLEWTELPTPHPVVEPVSDIRVRNGNFRCRDGRQNWAHSR
jgi:hypothetical protein